ncbi:UvrB/UvrC motif-containing protein [Simkania negevensis]|uniref:UVR domain-containing protein n=1 Tax=Simkania negevensis (strain ATCC VR-1471 / DSM 27360 / Z) TaxID=331113 RepID=F8L5Y1_SIMNZ|nr:UvrB/UvrC motif-containing protein [Simkania negevensis]CCB88124.1 putative uncharacterized protein [Simkania negevensis Z]
MEERPLECSQCKKKAAVVYQEVVGAQITVHHMCIECPVLKQKLEGKKDEKSAEAPKKEEGLCCSTCHTSLESLLLGQPLGCRDCYVIFQDILTDQLTAMNQIAPNVKPSQKSKNSSFHVGSTPQTNQKELNSCRLNSLNEALSDALKGENYEQAAWLRDQINSLMENTHE